MGRRKSNGRCCPNSLPQYLQCPECRAYWQAYMRKYMAKRHASRDGICQQCNSEDALPGHTRCATCLSYHADWMRKHRT